MARKIKAHTRKRREAMTVSAVPGGKIYTRADGAERFVSGDSGEIPRPAYTQAKRNSDKIQGKVI